ncbi:class I SAM-dependent methyltransferase [Desulfurivibrio dismutans]|uniref:class I SAM-dependent methyltransferase n=1 Tax=Desulfurivibrio dismutans TaxID=1398908 RepID=UPI0023DB5D43|nr:class I SAM-dependent methyltransferase [Desulfurivibrio alkaliphilus]MDF1614911.1 class I SAM-dependent methyltransferase [Desulfurivibrio alkaliphilus]
MTSNLAVSATDPARWADARQLAERLGLPLFDPDGQDNPPLLLQLTPKRLELRQTGKQAPGPVYVDFAAERLAYRRRQSGRRRENLARAVGLKGGYRPAVIDATAGLGRDAFILAALGCRVQMLERSPIVHALLADGLQRAAGTADIAALVRENLQLLAGDALTFLTQSPFPAADVIYLDPMFPERTKSALVKKEMRLLRQIAGDDTDAGPLLAAALQKAGRRVVVKRPRHAPALPGPAPGFSLSGKSSRFDVYLLNRRP